MCYLGYGPHESYVDKRRASTFGEYSATVQQLHFDYIKPQENGSHWGCRTLRLNSDAGLGFDVTGKPAFSFNASRYTQEELTQKGHNYELQPSGSCVLCIDHAQNGIGTNSCGPELLEAYRFDAESFAFEISITPIR